MTTAPEPDSDCGCTCNGYKMFGGLHRYAKPSVFVTVLSVFAVLLGTIQGFFNVHYQANSINASLGLIEWLMVVSQLVQALIVVPVVYGGGSRHRPVWLSGFAIFLVVCCIGFGSLILTENDVNEVTTTYNLQQDPTLCSKSSDQVELASTRARADPDWVTLTAVYLVHLSLGLASVCFFAFAITYIDDNVDATNSPGIIGIVLGLQQIGPLLGMALGWLCSNTTVTGFLWIVLAASLLAASTLLGMFPQSLLDSEGGLAASNVYYTKSKGFLGSFMRVLTNRIFLLITLGLTLAYTAIWNFKDLLPRYEESVYYAAQTNGFGDSWTARQTTTILRPVFAGGTIIAAGITMYRTQPTPVKLSVWTTAALFFTAAVFFANIFLTCSDVRITTESKHRLDLTMYCNKDCGCREDLAFTPVYASHARLVYFSPCHAGCTTVYYVGQDKVYKNCSCVPTEAVVSGVYDQGWCLAYGIMFQCLTVLTAVLVASVVIGLLMLSFRVVLSCDKPLMIGLQFTIVTLFATIPGRQLFLIVARLSCIVSGADQCRLHRAQPFVTYINLTTILFLLLAVAIFVIATFMVRNVILYGDIELARTPKKLAALTELREFRTKTTQGKTRRHSFHGEDQKLLDTDGPPVTVQRAPSVSLDSDHRLSTYEGQIQKAASYSEELNKLLQSPPASGNTLLVPSPGVTVRKEGMLTTLL